MIRCLPSVVRPQPARIAEGALELEIVGAVDEAVGGEIGQAIDLVVDRSDALTEIARVEAALADHLAGREVRFLQPRLSVFAGRFVEIPVMDEQAFGVVVDVMR
jgi:hypothetical protein